MVPSDGPIEGFYTVFPTPTPVVAVELVNIPYTNKFVMHRQPAADEELREVAGWLDITGNGSVRSRVRACVRAWAKPEGGG